MGYGPVAPFVLALAPLVVCGILVIQTWEENYGNRKTNFSGSCMEGLRIIFNDTNVLLLGTIQVWYGLHRLESIKHVKKNQFSV